jgi:hypothetical protein
MEPSCGCCLIAFICIILDFPCQFWPECYSIIIVTMAPKAMKLMKAMKAKGGAKGGAVKPMKAGGGKGGAKGKDKDKDTGIKVNDMGKNNGALPAPSLPAAPAIPEDCSDCN